jgi:hypothetical protein
MLLLTLAGVKYLFVEPSVKASVFTAAPLVEKYLFVDPCAKSSVVLPVKTLLPSKLITPDVELYSIGDTLLNAPLISDVVTCVAVPTLTVVGVEVTLTVFVVVSTLIVEVFAVTDIVDIAMLPPYVVVKAVKPAVALGFPKVESGEYL